LVGAPVRRAPSRLLSRAPGLRRRHKESRSGRGGVVSTGQARRAVSSASSGSYDVQEDVADRCRIPPGPAHAVGNPGLVQVSSMVWNDSPRARAHVRARKNYPAVIPATPCAAASCRATAGFPQTGVHDASSTSARAAERLRTGVGPHFEAALRELAPDPAPTPRRLNRDRLRPTAPAQPGDSRSPWIVTDGRFASGHTRETGSASVGG
jgi:hypothetical protein